MSVPTGLVSHVQRVKRLYKKALRNLESWYDRRDVYRYYAVTMRDRFDQHKDVKDMAVARHLLEEGEDELFHKQHWHVKQFVNSPGGSAYQREVVPPDWVLDYWHPLEKAQYPEYFERREKRKAEYIKFWEGQFLCKEKPKGCDETDPKKDPEPC
ncbi:hypothetical protein Zmor_009368 [Zophobas morio]|uniref:NADH dehydrogenase [ubiquinone] 1 beta subcomplex subunit 9 n=1 Tax=Zophobas morio TaxID=2755281 RepID=A0AA38MIM8_9CUCU|nr:hypothetical protein Zmor_009368 [Zophobas morio]